MKHLLADVGLAFAWCALTGKLTAANFAVGFALADVVVWLTLRRQRKPYLRRLAGGVALGAFFAVEVFRSALRVAADVIAIRPRMAPAIVDVPLEEASDLEIALVAILVTLTPGILALDVSEDRRTLWVHAMYAADPDEVRSEVKDGFERRVLEVMR